MKKVRSGFTMVELLFVMAVLAALAAIAIPQLKGGTDSAALTSMQSDTRNFITDVNTYFAQNQALPAADSFSDGTNNDGLSETNLGDSPVPISKNNTIEYSLDTDSGATCYKLSTTSTALTGKKVTYDSCGTGKIKIENN